MLGSAVDKHSLTREWPRYAYTSAFVVVCNGVESKEFIETTFKREL